MASSAKQLQRVRTYTHTPLYSTATHWIYHRDVSNSSDRKMGKEVAKKK